MLFDEVVVDEEVEAAAVNDVKLGRKGLRLIVGRPGKFDRLFGGMSRGSIDPGAELNGRGRLDVAQELRPGQHLSPHQTNIGPCVVLASDWMPDRAFNICMGDACVEKTDIPGSSLFWPH